MSPGKFFCSIFKLHFYLDLNIGLTIIYVALSYDGIMMAMFNEENIRIISLDAESRVRGVCQLMEGLIFDLRITPSSSEGEVTFTVKSFSTAMDFLDNCLLMAYSFIEKYRRLKIDEKEEKNIVE